jgi:SAM-dependent MidA family methyltransferase
LCFQNTLTTRKISILGASAARLKPQFSSPQFIQFVTTAEQLIRSEIAAKGAISFHRFMELALYAPGAGYYEQPARSIGKDGDFHTSVSVGPMLGFLLASHFAQLCRDWETIDLLEAGSHDGRLASDILAAFQQFHPDILPRLRYYLLEPSPVRRALQQSHLASFSRNMTWLDSWNDLPRPIHGFIFANELLDSFPVRRLVWDSHSHTWGETGVTLSNNRLDWCRIHHNARAPDAFAPAIPDGFIVECCPAAQTWWEQAAAALARGWLITLDYGFDTDSAIRPEHPKGTLRAYFKHKVSHDLLARPGEQDLTAHVDFRRLIRAGAAMGLHLELLREQGRWLSGIAAAMLAREGPEAHWLQSHARQLHTLAHPNLLGSPLKVLIQRRD